MIVTQAKGIRLFLAGACVLGAGLFAWMGAAAFSREGWAQALVADLSSHLVAITTGFTGTEVVLFGAVDGLEGGAGASGAPRPGAVAVVVQGPETETTVRQKDRVAGIWVNTRQMTFARVPTYYGVATSAPVEGLAPPAVLHRHEIGLDNLRLVPEGDASPETVAEFRAALIRNKQRADLYGTETGQVAFLGQRLFRTTIYFPANVPTGLYTVSVFLIRDGDVVSAQTTPLSVSKIGFSASLSDFARRRSFAYAVVGLLLAVAAGWLAGLMFRRG